MGSTTLRPLLILTGILAIAAGIMTFVWPDITLYVVSIFVAWYLTPPEAGKRVERMTG